ncbi:MAG: hypothetical protein EOO98_11135, partial [Pedobacter sp.]
GSAYGKVSSSSDVESINGKKGVVNINLNDVLTAGNTSSQPISVGAIAAGSGSITSAPTQPTNIVRLADLSAYQPIATAVTSVAGKMGAVTLNKYDVQLGNVDNTSDVLKPISNPTNAALNLKADKSEIATGQTIGANTTGNAATATTSNGLGIYTWNAAPISAFDYLFGRNAANEIRPISGASIKSALATSLQDVTSVGNTTSLELRSSNGTIVSGLSYSDKAIIGALSNHALGIYAGATEKMTVLPNGNVGIGTTNPTQKLDVNGNIQTQAQFFNGTNTTGLITPMDGNVLVMEAFNKTNSVKYPIALNPYGGNVGIGTATPSEKLEVSGNIKAAYFLGNASALSAYNGANTIRWGWDGNFFTAKVDNSDFGNTIPLNITGTATGWSGANSKADKTGGNNFSGTQTFADNVTLTGASALLSVRGGIRLGYLSAFYGSFTTATSGISGKSLGQIQLNLANTDGSLSQSYEGNLKRPDIAANYNWILPAYSGVIVGNIERNEPLDFPNVMMNQNATLTVTVTGAEIGDAISLGLPNSILSTMTAWNGTFQAWVSAANTVSVRFQNSDPMSAHDLPSGQFKIRVLK